MEICGDMLSALRTTSPSLASGPTRADTAATTLLEPRAVDVTRLDGAAAALEKPRADAMEWLIRVCCCCDAFTTTRSSLPLEPRDRSMMGAAAPIDCAPGAELVSTCIHGAPPVLPACCANVCVLLFARPR